MVTVPCGTVRSSGPRMGSRVAPVGSSATSWVPLGTSAVANSPLAMLVNTVCPSTRTSAGGTTAVCATRTRAFPGPIGSVGVA